jgi:hypothetical protein
MTMSFKTNELLRSLGIRRVIWIDDVFDSSLDNVKAALLRDPTPLHNLELPAFSAAMKAENDIDRFDRLLGTALEATTEADLRELKDEIRRLAAVRENELSYIDSPKTDLPVETIELACKILNVAAEDRVSFESGLSLIQSAKSEDDNNAVAYIVDLQDALRRADIGAAAGVEVLKRIYARQRSERVFVLTHEALIETESEKEDQIVQALGDALIGHPYPCVISKVRINKADPEALAEGLQIALKRSSLRREIFNVCSEAQEKAATAINKTRAEMSKIPPEELDSFFVKRAISEGASDLHMIERIISAQVSIGLQEMFTDNEAVRSSISVMRMLRDVPLTAPAIAKHPVIEKFRLDETWESGDFLKASYSPLGLGDIFETIEGTKRRFILLGQPCDLMLRDNGNRSGHVSDLVEVTDLIAGHSDQRHVYAARKTIDLRISADGGYLQFDFRNSSPARLEILDLVSYNSNGEVKIVSSQPILDSLLPGQVKALQKALKFLAAVTPKPKQKPAELELSRTKCALTLRTDKPFNAICSPKLLKNGAETSLLWNLKRIGRLRSPHVDVLIDQQMAILNRRAFDVDYLPDTKPVKVDS